MNELAGHSRVWIFQANRFLEPNEVKFVRTQMNEFVKGWASHGNDLFGATSVEYDLFIVVAVDEKRAPASGCSIDKLMRQIQDIGHELDIDFLDRLKIAYEDDSTEIHLVSVGEFKDLLKADKVTRQTIVYNNLVQTLDEFNNNWRTTVGNSWHKDLIQVL